MTDRGIEITEAEQPRLFAFISQLTKDTQTPFPKRIYLSPDVNACVFYDSGFWSMFLPVKKNLQIGLGLVNSVNASEFKAVMAHEFGHFSQRSMKLGSFVYNVNRVIHNMLFENRSYGSSLQTWANISDYFAFFANITVSIVKGIQSLLRDVYKVVNKSYMNLSREMEFHADAVAASVSGSESLVTSLRRIELAHSCYQATLNKCDEILKQKKVSRNIYDDHFFVMSRVSDEFRLERRNGLPVVNDEFLKATHLSRVNFRDQWASHPSTEEREKHLNTLNIKAKISEEPAWVLFDNPEELKEKLTQKIYEHVTLEGEKAVLSKADFEEHYTFDENRFSFPVIYKGFYDRRQITRLDVAAVLQQSGDELRFDEIFSLETASLPKKINAAENDIQVLRAISKGEIEARSFDFDGIKYEKYRAEEIAAQLEEETKKLKTEMEEKDKQAIRFFTGRH